MQSAALWLAVAPRVVSGFATGDKNALPVWGTSMKAEPGWAAFFNEYALAVF
ncbi:hypothetical protein QUF90_14345 [Desulfococcaceae bacterium HSG9]|nr:hypothetical protein [Desulfococcaceae bacterium HSG9]